MGRWMEEFYDKLLFVGILLGALTLFSHFWQETYQKQVARMLVTEFLERVAAKGSISEEEYEGLLDQISRINGNYEVELVYYGITEEPCYALVTEEQLKQYYLSRNVRRKEELPLYEPEHEVISDEWKLQEETNGSLLAAGEQQYLPLPEPDDSFRIDAVRKTQQVYEGEELITLCIVQTEQGLSYVEAEPVRVEESGIVELTVLLGNTRVYAEVEVLCYPRQRICDKGHIYRNTKEMILAEQEGSMIVCPVCNIIPKEIVLNCQNLVQNTGGELKAEEVWLTVKYQNGSEVKITPDSEEWLDDFDENFTGLQAVTIQYHGLQTQLIVVTEGNPCRNCGTICEGRYYTDYELFPYCVKCMSEVPLFTGEVRSVDYKQAMGEIVETLDREGKFAMERNDFLAVYIKERRNYIMTEQCRIRKNKGGM